MNYYKRHLGDYAAATRHLTMMEHGAYTLLLDLYYVAEKPLPADEKAVFRLVAARTPAEKSAVRQVLSEFFTLQDDGWHQSRCDRDIAEAQESTDETSSKRENEKERQRRYRERRKSMFEFLRERDVIPPWDIQMTELETLMERYKNAPVTRDSNAPETCTSTAIHKPLANSHKPITKEEATAAPPPRAHKHACEAGDEPPPPADPEKIPDEAPSRASQIAVLLRRNGADHRIAPNDRHIADWAASGVTDAQILTALETAKQRRSASGSQQPIGTAYLTPIIAELRSPAPATKPAGRFAEDIRQMREMSAWADGEIRKSQGHAQPAATTEIDMGAIDATSRH